jgi:hypothetical protein
MQRLEVSGAVRPIKGLLGVKGLNFSLLPKLINEFLRSFYYVRPHITHLRQECHNSKFDVFELLVQKEMSANALLTGIVS